MELSNILEKKLKERTSNPEEKVLVSEPVVKVTQELSIREVRESMKKRYISFDTETTGLSSTNDRIIELGAVIFENGEIVGRFSTLINTGKENPEESMKVNKITNEMLAEAPTESEVYPKFIEFLGEALTGEIVICAHNARFDMKFLKNTLERLGYSADIYFVDTLGVSKKLIPGLENYKQGTLENLFGITNEESHRAVTDAEACGKIMWELLNYEEKLSITTNAENEMRR